MSAACVFTKSLNCAQIRGSADSTSASCDFFCQIFSESSLPSSTAPAAFVIEFQRRAGDGFAFRAAFERISARLAATLQCIVRPYTGNA
jgi:hypothetical protein